MLRELGSSLAFQTLRRCCRRPARILLVAVGMLVSISRFQMVNDRVLATAAQQTRSSYLCRGLRSRSRNQWSEPCGVSSLGNITLSDVRRELSLCEIDCNWRTSRVGLLSVKLTASGAVNMAFSVFASAEATSRANREARLPGSFIVLAMEAGREEGCCKEWLRSSAASQLTQCRCLVDMVM